MSAVATESKPLLTTVSKELIVAVSGVLLVGFIIAHLSGNLLILVGPEAFNAYAEKMQGMGELLWVARAGMIVLFSSHIITAIMLARENRAKRSQRYAVQTTVGRKSLPTRFMALTGVMIAAFLVLHLTDFTLRDHHGEASMMGEQNMALYGLVWNSFSNPLRALVYIVAVSALGLHLSHAIASVVVTLGILSDKGTARADVVAKVVGAVVALGFASIPIYVLLQVHVLGGQV